MATSTDIVYRNSTDSIEEFFAKRLDVHDDTVRAWLDDAHHLVTRARPVQGADQVQLYWELRCPHVNASATRIPCAMMVECSACTDNAADGHIDKLKLLQDTDIDIAQHLDKSVILHGQPHVLSGDTSYVYVPEACGLYESLTAGHTDWLERLVSTRGFGEFFVDCVFDETQHHYTSTQAVKMVENVAETVTDTEKVAGQ